MTYIRTFALALMLLAAVSLPSSASAASMSDILAQLKAIQAQLEQMRGQVLGVSTNDALVLPAEEVVTTPSIADQPLVLPQGPAKADTDMPLILPGYVGPTVASTSSVSMYVEVVETQANAEQDGTLGDYSIEVEVTADDGDIFIPMTGGMTAKSGFDFSVISSPKWKGTYDSSVSTMGEESGNYLVIREGDTERIDFEVYLSPDAAGEYAVRLDSIQYAERAGGPLKPYMLTGAVRKAATTARVQLVGEAEDERKVVVEAIDAYAEGHAYDPSRGNFVVSFDVSAVGGDAFVSMKEGIIWGLFGPQMAKPKSTTYTLTSTAPTQNGYFVVEEEETDRFTFVVEAVAKKSGPHRLELFALTHAGSLGGKIEAYSLGGSGYRTNQLTLSTGTTTSSVKGTFNAKTLKAKTENPTIKGTASGTDTVGFSISQGDKVYGSGDIRVKKNGKWSHKVSEDLMGGTYTITLYADNVEIARGTLTVSLPEDEVASKMAIVVGVYEGYYPNGRGFRQHTEGTVTVNIKADSTSPAQPLVLSSYESTNWIINNPNNAKISKIITVGYYPGRVTGAPAGTPIEHYAVRQGDSVPVVTKSDGELKKLETWLLARGLYYSGVFYGGTNAPSVDIEYGYKG